MARATRGLQEEFENSETDAGELGSGHTVTVVYEIKLTEKALTEGENLAQVVVKYKPTENVGGDEAEQELIMDISTAAYHAQPTQTDAFVAGVVEFALLLRDSQYKADADLNALIKRLQALDLSADAFKEEFRQLVYLYQEQKKD